jgi:hypothetical protein
MLHKLLLKLLSALSLLITCEAPAFCQSLSTNAKELARALAPNTNAVSSEGILQPFKIGNFLESPNTPYLSYEELTTRTAGNVRPSALNLHNWESYRNASLKGRQGKFLEADEAFRANLHAKETGSPNRYLVSQAEGVNNISADLVELGPDNKIQRLIQAKASADEAFKALADPKYAGMDILTHPDQLDRLKAELRRAKALSARRGIPLAPKYATLESALDSGRLSDELARGLKLRRRDESLKLTDDFLRAQWLHRADELKDAGRLAGSSAAKTTSRSSAVLFKSLPALAKAGGVALLFGASAIQASHAISQFRKGELDQDIFAAKLGLYAKELSAGAVLLLSPEPFSKFSVAALLIASGFVVGADITLDYMNSSRREALRQRLQMLEWHDRHLFVIEDLKRRAANLDALR